MNYRSVIIPEKQDGSLNVLNGMYYFGEDLFDEGWSKRPKLDYEGSLWIFLNVGMECHFALVKRNKKIGFFYLEHTGMGGYGGTVLQAPMDAFKYDEVVEDDGSTDVYMIKYLAVRQGSKWGVMKLYDTFFMSEKASLPMVEEVVPVQYDSYQEAFAHPNLRPSWDAELWKRSFAIASANHETHEVRIQVYQSTLEICRKNSYFSQSGKPMDGFLATPSASSKNVFLDKEISLNPAEQRFDTHIEVFNDDCLKVAKDMVDKYGSEEVCVLNMANRQNPGGGVFGGAGAQEEQLFRRSDYFRFIYQYAKSFDPRQYGIEPNGSHRYPMDRNFGGIFSKGVTIFRSSEKDGYALLDEPWCVNMVAVAGINLKYENIGDRLPQQYVDGTLNKIRTIFRLSYNNGQRYLVLGALGCGAFGNPPAHIAELFHQVLEEPEFRGIFKGVSFAIIPDHNDFNNSNFLAFTSEFAKR